MKNFYAVECRRPQRGWLGWMAVTASLCVGLLSPASAENRGNLGGLPPPPAASGDETVGTLPALNGTGSIDFLRFVRDARASFYVQGDMDELFGAIVSAEGQSAVTVEVLDASSNQVRLTFHGRVRLSIDRNSMSAGTIQVGIAVPTSFGTGQARFWTNSGRSGPSTLSPGILPLPVNALMSAGTLNNSPLRAVLTSGIGARTALEIVAGRDLVVLTQSH